LQVFGRDEEGRNAALDASMSVSLRNFTEAECTRLYELAVFPNAVVIPESAVLTLWRGTARMDEFSGQELLARFAGGFTIPETNASFRIHDKLKEYLGGKLGGEASLVSIHRALISSYQEHYGDNWENCDPYGIYYLAEHMRKSKLWDELLILYHQISFIYTNLKLRGSDETLEDVYLTYISFKTHNLQDHSDRLSKIVLSHILREGSVESPRFSLDHVHSALVYRTDIGFLITVLEQGLDVNLLKSFVPSGSSTVLLRTTFLARLCNIYRRRGDLEKAEKFLNELLEDLNGHNELLKERSRAEYDIGYIYYLRGEFNVAIERFGKSAETSLQAGDVGGYHFTYYFQCRLKHLTGEFSDTMFDEIQTRTMQYFISISTNDSNAQRWIMNVYRYQLEVYFTRSDAESMEPILQLLEKDEWLKRYETDHFLNEYRALYAMLKHRYVVAIDYLEDYINFIMLTGNADEIKRREAAARILYYYGLALCGSGHVHKAITVWRDALNFSDDLGNRIWKQRIRASLVKYET